MKKEREKREQKVATIIKYCPVYAEGTERCHLQFLIEQIFKKINVWPKGEVRENIMEKYLHTTDVKYPECRATLEHYQRSLAPHAIKDPRPDVPPLCEFSKHHRKRPGDLAYAQTTNGCTEIAKMVATVNAITTFNL